MTGRVSPGARAAATNCGRVLALSAVVFSALVAVPAHASVVAPSPNASPVRARSFHTRVPEVDRDHVFVKFRAHASNVVAHVAGAGAAIERLMTRAGWAVLQTRGHALDVAKRLRHDPTIATVSLSYIRHATSVPNDPRWASAQRDYLGPLRMDRAWDVTKGAGVTVAVIDTGADLGHPDLTGQFVNSGINELAPGSPAQDDNGHGTMTAGIIGAKINNGLDIAGIAPQAKILPVKVLDSSGNGNDDDIAQGIEDATAAHVKVISMSLGGAGGGEVLCPAVQDAIDAGIVVVAAAGNDFAETVGYPASCPGVIAVSATNHDGSLSAFSSYGWRVDIAAPGFDITSTALGGGDATESGTSFSTPIVAGVVALVRAQNPAMTEAAARSQVVDTARDVGPPGVDAAFGHGIVDPLAALGGPPLAPHPTLASGLDEPNNTPATATPIALGTIDRAIAPETDEDWYNVSLTGGTWYQVNVEPLQSGFDHDMMPVIELYDSSDHFLASQEFAGGSLTFKAPASAHYLVRVSSLEGSTSTYRMQIGATGQPPLLTAPIPVDLELATQSVSIGDVNGDGRNDIAFLLGDADGFPYGDTIVELHQTATRSFTLANAMPVPLINGDGLVVANAIGDAKADALFPTSTGLEIIPGTANGLDNAAADWVALSTPGATVRQIAVADIDGDGQNDVVVATDHGVKVFFSASGAAVALDATSATAIAADTTNHEVAAVEGATVKTFVHTVGHTFTTTPISVANARGIAIDPSTGNVAVSQHTSPGSVALFTKVGVPAGSRAVASMPDSIAIADIDGGGNDIVVLHDSTGNVGVVPGSAGTESTFAGDTRPAAQYDARALAVGDLLGDGGNDVVVATSFGISIVPHRMEALAPNFGSHVIVGSNPDPLTEVADGSAPLTLNLSNVSTNAAATVHLLDAHGDPASIATPSDGTTVTVQPSPGALGTGAYTVRIDGLQDAAGDQLDGYSLPFIVGNLDETPPNLSLSAPSGFVPTPPHISFSSSDAQPPTFECRLDNTTFHACVSPVVVNTAGPHALDVLARDAAGNETIRSASWNYRPPPHGYWMVGAAGTVYPFGSVPHLGSAMAFGAVDVEASPSGFGYWVVDFAGHVFAFGDARYYGGAGALPAGEFVTSISRTATGKGYWLFTTRGRVIARGDAHNYGDVHLERLNGPVIDSVATPSGHGYYMVASDGGVFTFGDAKFYGSMGASRIPAPVRTLTPDPDGVGYWLVGTDGAVYSFRATYRGSMGGRRLSKPVVGMVAFGNGYLMVAADGGIFDFSNKPFDGSLGGHPPAIPIVSVAAFG